MLFLFEQFRWNCVCVCFGLNCINNCFSFLFVELLYVNKYSLKFEDVFEFLYDKYLYFVKYNILKIIKYM